MTQKHTCVLIDAANLSAGGGVQVAASFIDELASIRSTGALQTRFPWLYGGVTIQASSAVHRNLTTKANTLSIELVDRSPRHLKSWMPRRRFCVSFTVFGPFYGRPPAVREICGFADGVSLFPRPHGMNWRGFSRETRWAARAGLSRLMFSRSDVLVVEATHVADALCERWNIDRQKIKVVPNVLNSVFLSDTQKAESPDDRSPAKICYVTRAYAHKNMDMLGPVGEILQQDYGLTVKFLVTLNKEEWAARTSMFRRHAENLGPVSIGNVPNVYAQSRAAIFPSLLESFSVTPLEALSCRRPLIAADREFVRSIVGNAASYFDPLSPESAARATARILTSDAYYEELLALGTTKIEGWPTAKDRAISYLEVIDDQVKECHVNDSTFSD